MESAGGVGGESVKRGMKVVRVWVREDPDGGILA